MLSSFFSRPTTCPSEQRLAEYADQQLIGSERHAIETHLVECGKCLQQVGFLVRMTEADAPVPPEVLYVAKRLGKKNSQGGAASLWRPAAAVACLLVVAGAGWLLGHRSASGPNEQPRVAEQARVEPPSLPAPSTQSQEQVRGVQKSGTPTILSPAPDAIVAPSAFVIRWEAVRSAEYYEVVVVTEAGDVVWKKRTNQTSIKLPAGASLRQGHCYYVWIATQSSILGLLRSAPVRFVAG